MKMRKESYGHLVTIAVMLFFLSLTLMLERFPAKIVPLIAIAIGLAAAIIGLARSVQVGDEEVRGVPAGETVKVRAGRQKWQSYMILAWLAGLYLLLYIFGILIGGALFILPFMRFHGVRWWVALVFTVVTPAFIYALFGVVLEVYLYQGLFLSS